MPSEFVHKRTKLPSPPEPTLRVLSVEEQATIERLWELSLECARLQERQRAIKERIGEKSGVYSNRC